MASFDFNPFAEYVTLTVRCPECGHVQTFDVATPMADFSADSHRQSVGTAYEEAECANCGHLFEISTANGIGGGDGEIAGLNDEDLIDWTEHFADDDWEGLDDEDFYAEYIDPHVREIRDVLDRLDCLDEQTRKILYRDLYANVISCLEAYLSDTIISKVLGDEKIKRKFVENSQSFKIQTLKISEFFQVQANLDKLIVKRLREIIYHKLDIVKPLYRDTLGADLGDISSLMKAVEIRNDIVHRNGRDKDGNLRDISKQDVLDLIKEVSDFIQSIEAQLNGYDNPITEDDIASIFGME